MELLSQVLDNFVLPLVQLLVQFHLLMQVPGGFDITVGMPSRITLVADRLDSMLGTLELIYQ